MHFNRIYDAKCCYHSIVVCQVDLLSRLRCPYISQFLGYCADQHHRLLIFEYMPNGSLERHLHRSCGTTLNWPIRMRIALDCARALEYLHEHINPSIIHRNFKCSNILLDHNFRAKLSGFGLAKIGSDKLNGLILTRVLGTTGYLAPEWVSIYLLLYVVALIFSWCNQSIYHRGKQTGSCEHVSS